MKTNVRGAAAAFVSNCHSESGRETVIRKLKQHIGVDVYGTGACSDPGLQCPRSDDKKCLEMLSTSYKVTQISLGSLRYVRNVR